jgi:hypothetical protein
MLNRPGVLRVSLHLARDTDGPAGGCGSQHIVHLETDATVAGQRHRRQVGHPLLPVAFGQEHHVVAHDHGPSAARPVGHDERVQGIAGEKDHRARTIGRHGHGHGIVGIEHGSAGGRHVLHDGSLHLGQLLGGLDTSHTQVVALANVGDDGHVALVEAQPLAQDPATGGF